MVAVVATALIAQVVVTLPAHSALRSPEGHGQNLSAILALIATARRIDPGIPVLIPSGTADAALRAADPVQQRNPLRHLDPAIPHVPPRLGGLGRTVTSMTTTDLGWTALLLERR